GLCELAKRFPRTRLATVPLVLLTLGGCLAVTRAQIFYWRDSESLYRHAIAVTECNFVAYNNLGTALQSKGMLDEAVACYTQALRCKPDQSEAHNNLGQALMNAG